MYSETRLELIKIRETLNVIAAQLDKMDSDEVEEAADAVAAIADEVKDAIEKTDKALLLPDDEIEEDEHTPEHEPIQWQVGDLLNHKSYDRCLILQIPHQVPNPYDERVYGLISETGYQFMMREPHGFSHNTGLIYEYSNLATTWSDFQAGLFTPYFEIL